MADDIIQRLNILRLQLDRNVPVLQIIFGTFGNIMNILIFTRRSLRKNPCCIYLLALSINNLFVLYVALFTHLLANGWNIDPSSTNTILCKLRLFFVHITSCLTQWFIVLASIDRFLASCDNNNYRQWSNKHIARKARILVLILITIVHVHTLIWWSSGSVDSTPICTIFNPVYGLFFSIFCLLFNCFLPLLLMIIFGVKTILNVRKIRMQVTSQNQNTTNQHLHSKDRQMITMLLSQVLVTIICTIPFTVFTLYSTIQSNGEINLPNLSDMAIYNFVADICLLLSYCNPVIGFYIYILTSRIFRKEMKHVFERLFVIIGFGRCLAGIKRRISWQEEQAFTIN